MVHTNSNDLLSKFRFGLREWYQDNRRRQFRCWGLFGATVGFISGVFFRKRRMHYCEFGDHIVMTEYYIDKDHTNEFELLWNEHAKLTQRCEGYQGTKLFKVLDKDWSSNHQEEKRHYCPKDMIAQTTQISGYHHTQSDATGTVSEGPIELLEHQRYPFQYLQLRSWNSPEAEKQWTLQVDIQKIIQQIKHICKRVETYEYSTLADDKIKRLVC